MMPKLKVKSNVRMKISTQGEEKEKKEHKTGFWFSLVNCSSHEFHPQFWICVKSQDENSTQVGGEKEKKESKTGFLTRIGPPQFWICIKSQDENSTKGGKKESKTSFFT